MFKINEEKDISRVKRSKKQKRRARIRRFFLVLLTLTTFGLITVFAGVFFINYRLQDMPNIDTQYLKTYPTSEIVDNKGEPIWKPIDQRVETISYEEIPELYETLLITVEDQDFWESKGFSPKGIANMVVGTIREKVDEDYNARGGSTIDQQLIKNKFFNRGYGHEVTKRKIQELFLSRQLNENFKKEEILTFYVNDLEFAEGAMGIKAIMRTYFNKSPEDYEEMTTENIAEIAYLTGLSQAPSRYNLYTEPENANLRTLTVLTIARNEGVITESQYQLAALHDLESNLQERSWQANEQHQKNLRYKAYTDGARKELRDMGYDLEALSVRVQTHLDTDLYQQIEDKVREDHYYLDSNQQMAVSVLNAENIVVGMVGSRYGEDELNRATQQTRSSGSATKPMLAYAPLLQHFGGKYTTATTFDTSNYRYPGSKAVMHNYGQGVYGHQTMQKSLEQSYNTPVGRIMDGILGVDRVKNFLAGIGMDNQETYTSVDGLGIHVSTLQSASGFNAFNNLGVYSPPRFVDTIVFSNGEEKKIEPLKRQAMNPSVAWVTNHMMRGVPQEGSTGRVAQIENFPGYAAKTGTVGFSSAVNAPAPYGIGSSDLWFNSITNGGYSISIWAGYDEPNTSPQLPSHYRDHQILGRDLQLMLNSEPPRVWEQPSGVRKLSGSGLGAYYQVTDSSAEVVQPPSWKDMDYYNALDLERVSGNDEVKSTWEEEEESEWFEYYKNEGDLSPNVIDEELYQRMKGSD